MALIIALAVHVFAFGLREAEDGVQSAGDGGEARVSIQAASASTAAMVEDWERPPEVATETALAQPTDLDATQPRPPTLSDVAQPERVQPPELTTSPSEVAPPDAVAQTAPTIPKPDVAAAPELPDATALELPSAPQTKTLAALPTPSAPRVEAPSRPDLAPPPTPQSPQIDTSSAPIPLLDNSGNVQRSLRPQQKPQSEQARAAAQAAEAKSQAARAPAPAPTPRATQPAPSSRASNQQRASGSGNTQNAGNNQRAQVATLSSSQRASLMRQWGAKVRARVERNQRYPSRARGASGRVVVRISVSGSGGLAGVSVVRSSGNSLIDKAAVDAVRRARSFARAPEGLGNGPHVFDIPMSFSG